MNLLRPFSKDHPQPQTEDGQGLVEYALLLVLIAVAVITSLSLLGTNVNTVFQTVADKLEGNPLSIGEAFHWPGLGQKVYISATYDGSNSGITLQIKIDNKPDDPDNALYTTNMQYQSSVNNYKADISYDTLGGPCASYCTYVITASDPEGSTISGSTTRGTGTPP